MALLTDSYILVYLDMHAHVRMDTFRLYYTLISTLCFTVLFLLTASGHCAHCRTHNPTLPVASFFVLVVLACGLLVLLRSCIRYRTSIHLLAQIPWRIQRIAGAWHLNHRRQVPVLTMVCQHVSALSALSALSVVFDLCLSVHSVVVSA